MLKFVAVLTFLWAFDCLAAQPSGIVFTSENFERQILEYKPVQRAGVSDTDYQYGSMILRETKSATAADPGAFNVADYWNVMVAFMALEESSDAFQIAFEKAITADAATVCAYLTAMSGENRKYGEIRTALRKASIDCATYENKPRPAPDAAIDHKLLAQLKEISDRDQKFRKAKTSDLDRQRELDAENMRAIDQLYDQYGEYLGKSLVGEAYSSTMWAVIQHSTLEKMEFYLPVVAQAVQEKELAEQPLKMLLDRIHTIRFGYQIFGSQGPDIPLAPAGVQALVRSKYWD